jgi:ectoine hydroxylase-related dioxygenase (phytanoyl-CoA dioxygenase family)
MADHLRREADMEIGDWQTTAELNQVMRQARELGIERNLLELEAFGFTVVPPDVLGAGDLPKRMFDATMRLCDEVEAAGGKMSGPGNVNWEYSHFLHYLIARDPAFIEAVMHPVTLVLARYMMGASCRLFTTSTFVKRGKATSTPLHVDSQGNPPPLYPYAVVCNISWILTDYTEENGTFAIVPGSQRYCRHPTKTELPEIMGGTGPNICVPVEAKAGSLIVFTGNTWHGTYPKIDPVLRAHVVTGFCRNYMLPAEDYRNFPEHTAEKYGPEFQRLLGRTSWQGYTTEGPKGENIRALDRANITPSA